MKRRGPRSKWKKSVEELTTGFVVGGAIGLAFDAMLFIWLFVR